MAQTITSCRTRALRLTSRLMLTAGFLITLSLEAYAWWDTELMAEGDPPKVAEVEAETLGADGAEVVEDRPPFGPMAGGGAAVRLEPGHGSLNWRLPLNRSTYVLFAIARVAEADPVASKTPEWPIFARLKVVGPDGKQVGDWAMPINYLNTCADTARMYFPAGAGPTAWRSATGSSWRWRSWTRPGR